ncbi:MAG: DUF4037 domain-containing protein [Lachnospiraceae bacterium]|nr:DUF4037 domain-containing protein [Lachnospiraceae bacterium]
MKGLEISKAYYNEIVKPRLESEHPEVLPFIAVGLSGEGSECFGFDDEVSKDHSFGVRIIIWLNDDKADELLEMLKSFYRELPDEYMGMKLVQTAPYEKCRSGVFTVSGFFRTLTGFAKAPEDEKAWFNIPEALFANAVNGEVFYDGSGEFTKRRNEFLSFYPEDVKRFLMAKHAALAAQSGQYNLTRLRLHGESTAAAMTKTYYVKHLMHLCFLSEGKYMPFYKWAPRALSELPGVYEISKTIDELVAENDIRAENALAEKAASSVISLLNMRGYTSSPSDYLMDHVGDILSKIRDDSLKRRPLDLSDM